jgi:hypothetical protein
MAAAEGGAGAARGRSLSKPEVVEINYTSMGLEDNRVDRQAPTSFKMPSDRKTALLNNRGTYNR